MSLTVLKYLQILPLGNGNILACGVVGKSVFFSLNGVVESTDVSQTATPGITLFCSDGKSYLKGIIDEVIVDTPSILEHVESMIQKHYKRGNFPSIGKFSAETKALIDGANDLSAVNEFELFDEVNNIKIKYGPNKNMNLVDQDIDGAINMDKGFSLLIPPI